jgi:hypothetical protein
MGFNGRSNQIDNLTKNYNRKIEKRINNAINANDNLVNRGASQMRSSPVGFAGIVLKNIKSVDYATFGFSTSGTTVGP